MLEKIKCFIETHFVGFFGLLMFLFLFIVNILPKLFQRLAKYDLPHIDVLFIVLGLGLILYELIPHQADYMASRLQDRILLLTDRLTPQSTLIIICALTALGFYLRLHNLSGRSFWFDEAITSYAAIGILEHGSPVLPSGAVYKRALLNSYLIALSFKTFGISELSARIASVIFGTLTIPLVYLLGKELGKRTGLIAALLVTFSAFEIFWAREARMYAQLQFLYLLTAYLFYTSLQKKNEKLFLLSVIPFILAWYSHVFSLFFIPVAIMYVLLCERREFLKNKYFVYVILGVMGLAFIYMIATGKTPFDYLPSNVPLWAQHTVLHYVFAKVLSILLLLVAISTPILLTVQKFGIQREKAHRYYLLNFFLPFVFLSVYPWKFYRYTFFIFPFLVILASYALDFFVLQNKQNFTLVQLSDKFKIGEVAMGNIKKVVVISIILLLFVQVSMDFYLNSRDDYSNMLETRDNWKKAGGFVKERLDDADKVAATVSLTTLYYVGQIDYLVCQNECPEYTNKYGFAGDFYSGCTILHNYDLFMQTATSGKGWLIADKGRLDGYWTDPKVRDYIRTNMTYYPEGSDETIEVYSWGDVSFNR